MRLRRLKKRVQTKTRLEDLVEEKTSVVNFAYKNYEVSIKEKKNGWKNKQACPKGMT